MLCACIGAHGQRGGQGECERGRKGYHNIFAVVGFGKPQSYM